MTVSRSQMNQLRRPPRVTISQLADALGVSKGTVSRALNDYPDISESTRHRVKRQAERMGYRPLSHAQAIRTGRTRSIGLVLQTGVYDGQRPFLAEFLAGVTQAASGENWSLTVATAASDSDMLATLSRLIEEHKADGFILPRTMIADPRVALLREAGAPFIMYGRTQDAAGCSWYDILGEHAMRDAVLRLADLGHRRIAFVNGGSEFYYSHLRRQGYLEGLERAGLTADPAIMAGDALTRAQGKRATAQLLRLDRPPTAIVFAVDLAAIGAYDAAAECGIEIGREVSVIGYDGVPEGGFARPPLTTFDVDSQRAGARLAHLLIRQIRGEDPETLRETEHARLVVRGSDAPPAVSSEELARMIRAARLHDN